MNGQELIKPISHGSIDATCNALLQHAKQILKTEIPYAAKLQLRVEKGCVYMPAPFSGEIPVCGYEGSKIQSYI